MEPAWKQYAADFDNLTDAEVERECEVAQRDLDEAESWLEAVASWKDAGRPRILTTEPTSVKGGE